MPLKKLLFVTFNPEIFQHEKAKKQLDVINKAKENLLKKNSVQINLN